MQPDFNSAHFLEGLALYHLKKYEEAIIILKNLSVPWAGNGPLVTLILSYYRSGKKAETKDLIDKIKDDRFALGLIQLTEDNYEEAYTIFLGIKWWDYWEMLSIHHFYPDLLDKVRQNERFKHILYILNKNWGMHSGLMER